MRMLEMQRRIDLWLFAEANFPVAKDSNPFMKIVAQFLGPSNWPK